MTTATKHCKHGIEPRWCTHCITPEMFNAITNQPGRRSTMTVYGNVEASLDAYDQRPRAVTLDEIIGEVIELEGIAANHAAIGKTINERTKNAEERAISAFAETGAQDITIDGRRWKPDFKTIVSPATGQTDTLVQFISEHGGEDLIQMSMHHARRDAWLREKCINDDGEITIPDELTGLVQVFEKVSLGKRKV